MADEQLALIRAWEPDRYIAALYAPDAARPHLFALYAFAVEVARIPSLVSEPQLGEIRLQWWLDTLEALEAGQGVDHPVAQGLAATAKAFDLPYAFLGDMVEARREDLYADVLPNLFSVESYVAETDVALGQMAAMILDRPAAAAASAFTGPAMAAYGLARLMANENKWQRFVPEGESRDSLRALAAQKLAEAQQQHMPKSLLPALGPAGLTPFYLKGQPSPLRRQWSLWRTMRRGRI